MEYVPKVVAKSEGHGSRVAEYLHEVLGSISRTAKEKKKKQLEGSSKIKTWTDADTIEKDDAVIWIRFVCFPQEFTEESGSQMKMLGVSKA